MFPQQHPHPHKFGGWSIIAWRLVPVTKHVLRNLSVYRFINQTLRCGYKRLPQISPRFVTVHQQCSFIAVMEIF